MDWLFGHKAPPGIEEYEAIAAENSVCMPPPPGGLQQEEKKSKTTGKAKKALGDASNRGPSSRHEEETSCFKLVQQHQAQLEEMFGGEDEMEAPLAAFAKRGKVEKRKGRGKRGHVPRTQHEAALTRKEAEIEALKREIAALKAAGYLSVSETVMGDGASLERAPSEADEEPSSLEEAEEALLRACHDLMASGAEGDPEKRRAAERRMERLSAFCCEHPERKAREAAEWAAWEERERVDAAKALDRVRSFIPRDVEAWSADRLAEAYGGRRDLADRVVRRPVLRLVRMHPEDIAKLHAVDLTQRYATHGLDSTEARAVWQAVKDVRWLKDADGRKADWLAQLVAQLRASQDHTTNKKRKTALFDDDPTLPLFGPFQSAKNHSAKGGIGRGDSSGDSVVKRADVVKSNAFAPRSPPLRFRRTQSVPPVRSRKKNSLESPEPRPRVLSPGEHKPALEPAASLARVPVEPTKVALVEPPPRSHVVDPASPSVVRGRSTERADAPTKKTDLSRRHSAEDAGRRRSTSVPIAADDDRHVCRGRMRDAKPNNDAWWRDKVRAGASEKAVDRARKAAAQMRAAHQMAPAQPVFLTDFLRDNDLLKWDKPLGLRLYVTTDDVQDAMTDAQVDEIAQAHRFTKIDALRFKHALQRLREDASSRT